jgi:hypothetical protein
MENAKILVLTTVNLDLFEIPKNLSGPKTYEYDIELTQKNVKIFYQV